MADINSLFDADPLSEIQVIVKTELFQALVKDIALGLLRDYQIDIGKVITEQVERIVRNQMQSIKKQIEDEVLATIRSSSAAKYQQDLKDQLKRELREEMKNAVYQKRFTENAIDTIQKATASIAKSVISNVGREARQQFSQELMKQYKEEMILYFINDLRKSLHEKTTEIKPVIIDKSYALATNEMLPTELRLMNDVFRYSDEHGRMSAPSGIYFLYKNKVLQYIGQSVYVTERIAAHIGTKDFDESFFIPVAIGNLNHVETHLINLYKPPLNKHMGTAQYKDLNLVPAFIYKPTTPEENN